MPLRLVTLGYPQVTRNGRPLPGLASGKMSALLVYLALHAGQKPRREMLAELFWPHLPIEVARSYLRHAFFHLRKVLDRDSRAREFLSSGREWISFNAESDFWLDATEFSHTAPIAQEAAHLEYLSGLYRGEFMAGLSLPDCPEFENWLQMQRDALQRRALDFLKYLSGHYEQLGDGGKALTFALRCIDLEPLDENTISLAMRLYARNGQGSAAMAQYENYCRLLKKELGVLPGEKVRQLAKRIDSGELSPDRSMEPSAAAKTAPLSAPPTPTITPERRQVTVLYCELSTPDIEDPDEAIAVLRTPQAACMELVRQSAGHIVHLYGGGLLAYFGYPQAQEDAARRAVKAALEIPRGSDRSIDIRTGIHTGPVVTGADASMPDIAGMTSKIAIKLRLCAALNEVVISRQTHNLVAGYFDCIGLGEQSLPGFPQPLETYRAVRESGARTRLEAAAQLTPLVGRKAEIAELARLWNEARQGVRHIVLVQGEAGMGKSRLLHTLKERLADTQHAVHELRCFAEFSQSPLHPVIELLENLFDFAKGDAPAARSEKLAIFYETHYAAFAPKAVPLLAHLLSLPPVAHYPSLDLPLQKIKERTMAILLDLLQALATRQPVLLIVEDLHWVDPSTRELLTLFVTQTRSAPILALLTARPEFDPPWNEALESSLPLAPLADDDAKHLITSINPDIPPEVLHQIVERADGVPLFVEEIAKMASLDHKAIIPTTLHDLLAARMDRLGKAKITAQLASTIGREFDSDLLGKISPATPAEMARDLSALRDAGLIFPIGATSHQFKHALIQEAAYQSQTKTDRQTAHRRVAHALQNDFPDIVASQPEVVAQHFNAGGEARQAIEYWHKAVQRTAVQSANVEAVGYLQAALQALAGLPADNDRDRLEFTLQVRLGHALQTTQGFGSNTALQAFNIAVALAKRIGNAPGLFQALNGICFGISSHPDSGNTEALAIAHLLMDIAQESDDPHLLQQAHFVLGFMLFWIGDFSASRLHHEQSSALDAAIPWNERLDNLNRISGLSSRVYLSWVLWLEGFPEQAQTLSAQTIALARQHNNPHTLASTLFFAAMLQRWQENSEAALALVEEGLLLSQKAGLILWQVSNTMLQGWGIAKRGNPDGIAQIRMSIAQMRMVMGGVTIPFTATLAEVLLLHGQAEEALSVANESLDTCEKKNDHHFEAELHRLKGESLMQLLRYDEAKISFQRAAEISRSQGAKALELRAATSMENLR